MLDPNIHSLSGPDFLDAVADAYAADGLGINADIYRARARQWAAEQVALEDAQAALAKAARSQQPRLRRESAFAITPTDKRN